MKPEEHLKQIKTTALKLVEMVEAYEAQQSGDATPGQQAKELVTRFTVLWTNRYQQAYVPTWGKDIASMKRLLGKLAPAAIEQRMAQYLKSGETFYVQARHPLNLFVLNVNKFTGQAPKAQQADDDLFSGPSDCRHAPLCRTDEEHTRRKSAELRSRQPRAQTDEDPVF